MPRLGLLIVITPAYNPNAGPQPGAAATSNVTAYAPACVGRVVDGLPLGVAV